VLLPALLLPAALAHEDGYLSPSGRFDHIDRGRD
jgi:hypothetical protein